MVLQCLSTRCSVLWALRDTAACDPCVIGLRLPPPCTTSCIGHNPLHLTPGVCGALDTIDYI